MATPVRDPATLHDRAMQDLSFIRRTMEGAASFTDVPGWGLMSVGATAVVTAALTFRLRSVDRWLQAWLLEAVVAVAIGLVAIHRKMRRRAAAAGGAPFSLPARKFLLGLVPAIVAGAVLTFALLDPLRLPWQRGGAPAHLPGLWLLLYGTGVVTAGMFSVRPVPLMGMVFMGLGAVALAVPSVSGDLFLALGFGLVHVGFGAWIARRHGG